MKRPRPKARPIPLAIAVFIIAAGSFGLWFAAREGALETGPRELVEPVMLETREPVGVAAALVGGEPVLVADIQREAAAQGLIAPGDRLTPENEVYGRILQELIDQKLLAMEAAARGLDDAPETRRRLETARERILGNVLVETEVSNAVTDEAISRMYDEQVRLVELGDEVRARHILVETREEAEALLAELDAGADFATLAFEHSSDEATRLEGGDLGYFTADAMVGPLATAAYATPVGEISDPVQTEFGWHVVKVEDRRAQQRPTLENLRPRIVRFMTFDAIQQLLAGLRENAEIKVLTPDLSQDDGADTADDGPGNDPLSAFVDAMPANPAAGAGEDRADAEAELARAIDADAEAAADDPAEDR